MKCLLALSLGAACSGKQAGVDRSDATVTDGPAFLDAAGCVSVIENHVDEGAVHIPCSGPATYLTMPPSSGNHYPKWPDYKSYDAPVPWGNLVHALEHGAVVIVYNCPDGCADEVAQAQAFIDGLPADGLCTAPDVRRLILAPDPTLPSGVRWAASAWTWTLRAPCFSEQAFAGFVNDHYGQGREAICAELHLGLCP